MKSWNYSLCAAVTTSLVAICTGSTQAAEQCHISFGEEVFSVTASTDRGKVGIRAHASFDFPVKVGQSMVVLVKNPRLVGTVSIITVVKHSVGGETRWDTGLSGHLSKAASAGNRSELDAGRSLQAYVFWGRLQGARPSFADPPAVLPDSPDVVFEAWFAFGGRKEATLGYGRHCLQPLNTRDLDRCDLYNTQIWEKPRLSTWRMACLASPR